MIRVKVSGEVATQTFKRNLLGLHLHGDIIGDASGLRPTRGTSSPVPDCRESVDVHTTFGAVWT